MLYERVSLYTDFVPGDLTSVSAHRSSIYSDKMLLRVTLSNDGLLLFPTGNLYNLGRTGTQFMWKAKCATDP